MLSVQAFCLLPLCHLINHQVFIVHGGLFSKDKRIIIHSLHPKSAQDQFQMETPAIPEL